MAELLRVDRSVTVSVSASVGQVRHAHPVAAALSGREHRRASRYVVQPARHWSATEKLTHHSQEP